MDVIISSTTETALREYAARKGQDAAHFAAELLEEAARKLPLPADEAVSDALDKSIARIANRTPAERAAARARLLKASRPARPLPPGKTLEDVVLGQWPGEESDEEVARTLERLS